MIRQYEATRRTDTALTISVNPDDYIDSQEFELAVSVHASFGVQCLQQNRPVTAHAGSTHAIPRNATEFLDGCSGIDPDIDDNPNLAQTTLEHAPDASFYFFTVGRLKTIDDIKHMVLALPRSATCVVLQAATGQPRAIKRYSDFTLATVGDLNDLPMIMGCWHEHHIHQHRQFHRQPHRHRHQLRQHQHWHGDRHRHRSWANSTHSVIWMSRSGKSPAMPNTNQPHAAQYASLTVAALLTIAAASNLIDVYGSALSWTSAAIPATIIGSLVALAGLVPALRLWWQMLFMACAQLVVGPVIFLNGTTIAHVIPTLRTLTQGWMRMLGSFKYLLAIDPPTGTGDGSLLAVWTICLWAALLAGIFAVAEDGGLRWSRSFPSWRILRSARCLARRAASTVWRSARLWRSCWWFGSARVGNCWNWAVGSVP